MSFLRPSLLLLARTQLFNVRQTPAREIARWVAPTLKELRKRKELLGPQAPRPRSGFLEWNYDAELFAFAKRLNEEFNQALLLQALTHRSYIRAEEERQKKIQIDAPTLTMPENTELIAEGESLISNYVRTYLAHSLPKYPEAGLKVIHDHLMSEAILAHVSSHIGTKEIILTAEFPPETSTIADTFKALVAALHRSSGEERTFLFVRDFLLTQLHQDDINRHWTIEAPMNLFKEICASRKMGEPEPRLQSEMGKNTLTPVYRVGIYCDKREIGAGFGDSIDNATEVAALDCLYRLFETTDDRKPFDFTLTWKDLQQTKQKQNVRAS